MPGAVFPVPVIRVAVPVSMIAQLTQRLMPTDIDIEINMTSDRQAALYTMPMALRWRDLDAFNHVNNSTFLTFLEEARIRWFDSLDEDWVTDSVAPLLAAVQMNYRAPIAYPASIVVELFAERVGNSSVTIGHRIVSEDEHTRHADGHVVMVWIDRASGRPTSLPDAVRRAAGGGVSDQE